jgi:ATP-dependent DNA helicase RecG
MVEGDEYYRTKSVTSLRGVGEAIGAKFRSLGVDTLFDLLTDFPFRYLDETRITPAREAKDNKIPALYCLTTRSSRSFQPGRVRILKVSFEDESGLMNAVFFNSYPSFSNRFIPGAKVLAFGTAKHDQNGLMCLQHPKVVFLGRGEEPRLSDRLTPVYHSTAGLNQKTIRNAAQAAAESLKAIPLPELLPAQCNPFGMTLDEAIADTHRPKPASVPGVMVFPPQLDSFRRVCFEELAAYQIIMLSLKMRNERRTARAVPLNEELQHRVVEQLGFEPTPSQTQAFNEIMGDLGRGSPMLRLLHGDVGSGKTAVALMACAQAASAGLQSAVLAPTELLALQHFRKFRQVLEPLGISCALLTSEVKGRDRERVLSDLASGKCLVAIGTHSLFQPDVAYSSLTLAVIDEQHRFGTEQRLALLHKAPRGIAVHQLVMTATPIPRTQQLAIYAGLDVSVLKEPPRGRKPIITTMCEQSRRREVVTRLARACRKGVQAYWVCPRIDSDPEDIRGASSALDSYEELKKVMGERVALLHGRMSDQEKNETMRGFAEGRFSVLVATTIIEVGVDVPSATIMVIDSAELFGLAQLHQLRGRVGRGSGQSYCLLLYRAPGMEDDPKDAEVSMERLRIMRSTTDGFEIAEQDLQLRGPGDITGTEQTGFNVFRVADASRDADLAPGARKAAEEIIKAEPERARALVRRWFPAFSAAAGEG